MKKISSLIAKVILMAAFFSALEATAQPVITSFTPVSGCVCSNTLVTINGTGFIGVSSVTFSGQPASFTLVSAIQITATVPCAAVTGPIQVVTPAGTATSSINFTIDLYSYVSVSIAAVAPSPNIGFGPFATCTGTIYYFIATITNGGSSPTIQWYDGATPIGTPNSASLTYAVTSTSVIGCIVYYGGSGLPCPAGNPGTSNSIAFNPVATPNQPNTVTGLSTVCACQTAVTYTTSALGATSYIWQVPGSMLLTGQGTNTITVDWGCTPGTYTISVYGVNACGVQGVARTKLVTVNPLVAPPAVTIVDAAGGPTNIAQFTNIDFSALFTEMVVGKTVSWKVDGNIVFSCGPFTNSTIFAFPNVGSFSYGFPVCGIHTVTCEITFVGQPAPLQCYSPNISISNTITYNVCITGIEAISGDEKMLLYPNPVANELIIDNSESEILGVEVYNVLGEKRLSLQSFAHASPLRVDVSSLAEGIYFVKVRREKEERVARFVKAGK